MPSQLPSLNGTEFLNNPWNYSLSPWHQIFETVTGHGEVLWLFIVVVLTFGVYIISDKHPLYTGMFMVSVGSIFASANIFLGNPIMAVLFTIFTGIGIASILISIYFQRR